MTPLDSSLIEYQGFIQSQNHCPIFFSHYPGTERQKKKPVLIIPPILEERRNSLRTMVILSRKLATMGHPVLRFDFKGCGESGGDWKEKRLSDLIGDLREASHSLERLVPSTQQIWIGFRTGATLALLMEESPATAIFIGVAPVWKGRVEERHWRMRAKIRRELTSPTASPQTVSGANSAMEVDGQVIGAAFLEDLKGVDLMAQLKTVSFPVHILGISPFGDPSAEKERCQKGLGDRAKAAWISMDSFWDRLEETDVSLLVDHLLKTLG